MRNRVMIGTAALLLASATVAFGQEAPSTPVPPGSNEPAIAQGFFDFGYRGLSSTGDEARLERYRDMRNGSFSQLSFARETYAWTFDAKAWNIGYHDQRYAANFANTGKVKVGFLWDSIPLNYSYLSSSPWRQTASGSTAVFSLDAAARLAVQNKVAGVIGVPSTAAQAYAPSIYNPLSAGLDIQSRRDVAGFKASIAASRELSLNLAVNSTKKSGEQPFGMSFAFNNANELPMPLDNRTNDFAADLEWANAKGMFNVGWDGSWFNNAIHDVVWDNPLRATSFDKGGAIPYDPSAYSNGNGSAQGRISMMPDNNLNTFRVSGLYKLPSRTTFSANVAYGVGKQNDTLIPWTINPVVAPFAHPLERPTAEAEVHNVNTVLNLTSRPNRIVGFKVRYRYNDHKNVTPSMDLDENIRFDGVPEEGWGETEYLNIRQNRLDASTSFNLPANATFTVGYGYDDYARNHRSFANITDNTFRTALDVVGTQYVTLRGTYEYTQRTGSGYNEEFNLDSGAQPATRYYDEAPLDRNKGTVLLMVNPIEIMDVSFSVSAGKDEYNDADQEFGLLDSKVTTYNVGFNLHPTEMVGFGANYGYDKYSSLQASRNANPAPDPSWTDPARVWTLDNTEKVNNFNVYLDLAKAIEKTDVRLSYDFSDSNNGFLLGGPRTTAMAAIGQFIPVPDVTNQWQRIALDTKYYFSRKVGLGVGYWYEKFDINDFATIDAAGQPGTPQTTYLGIIGTGYGNRPYKGNTGFVRIIYLF